jgi:hypothetical protein
VGPDPLTRRPGRGEEAQNRIEHIFEFNARPSGRPEANPDL